MIEGMPHYEIYQSEIVINNKRNKVKELHEIEDINKMDITSDLVNAAAIAKVPTDQVFRNVSFSQVEKEKEEEEEKDNGGIINEKENESEGHEIMNDNNELEISPSFPPTHLTNIKEQKLSSSTHSEYHEMKIQMEIDKKVNEKVILAFDRNEFQELASDILQKTFKNLLSEVLYGEFSLYLPSSRIESGP